MSSVDLFSRYLDLQPLRSRRRGLVRCRFHDDWTGSLSVDLDRGLFHCFGCGVGGGLRRFRELVGEPGASLPSRPARPRSLLDEARARVLAEARRQQARLEPLRDLMLIADSIRTHLHAADRARRLACQLGPSEAAWEALELAACVEREALTVEAVVDEVLAHGRIA